MDTSSLLRSMRSGLAAVVVAVLLLVGACGSDDSDFDGTVRLGVALSETGRFSVEGTHSRHGYAAWEQWVNEERGGIRIGDKRYRAEIVYHDDESDGDRAADLVQQLIDTDKVDFLLGPYSSGITMGASAVAEANDVLMVQGNGTSDALFERGFRNLFGVSTVAGDYLGGAIEALAAEGAQTAVMAYKDSAFPAAVAEGALGHLQAHGMETVAVEIFPGDPTPDDIAAVMGKLSEVEAEVFIGAGHYSDSVEMLKTAATLGYAPNAMVLTVGPVDPDLRIDSGTNTDGLLGSTQWEPTMAYRGPYFGSALEYAEYYESLWGEPPVYQAASSTASALALQMAIENAGTLDTDAVRSALQSLDLETFYGPIRFDGRGVNVAKPIGTVQVQNTQVVVVAPASAATAELEYPLG